MLRSINFDIVSADRCIAADRTYRCVRIHLIESPTESEQSYSDLSTFISFARVLGIRISFLSRAIHHCTTTASHNLIAARMHWRMRDRSVNSSLGQPAIKRMSRHTSVSQSSLVRSARGGLCRHRARLSLHDYIESHGVNFLGSAERHHVSNSILRRHHISGINGGGGGIGRLKRTRGQSAAVTTVRDERERCVCVCVCTGRNKLDVAIKRPRPSGLMFGFVAVDPRTGHCPSPRSRICSRSEPHKTRWNFGTYTACMVHAPRDGGTGRTGRLERCSTLEIVV